MGTTHYLHVEGPGSDTQGVFFFFNTEKCTQPHEVENYVNQVATSDNITNVKSTLCLT